MAFNLDRTARKYLAARQVYDNIADDFCELLGATDSHSFGAPASTAFVYSGLRMNYWGNKLERQISDCPPMLDMLDVALEDDLRSVASSVLRLCDVDDVERYQNP